MLVIMSPSKTMKEMIECDRHLHLPIYMDHTKEIVNTLKDMSVSQIQDLMKINDRLAKLNNERFHNLKFDSKGLPAILSYDGLQYKNIQLDTFDNEELTYLDNHLRIISGLYGVLRPFSSIYPYRLEMQTRISINGSVNLYDYWNSSIYEALAMEANTIINLASNEYSKSILPYVDTHVTYITCIFKVRRGDKLKVESTASKIARGKMIHYIVKNKINNPMELKLFHEDGYRFVEEESTMNEYIFIQG